MVRSSIVFFILIFAFRLSAQLPENRSFEELRKEVKELSEKREVRIKAYLEQTKQQRSYRDRNGNLVVLVDVTTSGIPQYETTDNAGAAVTVGVDKLRTNGGLGLDLQGQGMIVGIWDGGSPKTHIELGEKILSAQGSEDTHASHVAGTILATGINANAKGMAPLAQAQTFDFNDDENEMMTLARPDESSILLSNHSYGLITGWRFEGTWQWFGDNNISPQEDYRFGLYTSATRLWDQITFNSPYYTICKSAGNDRSDVGSGVGHPADCDGGSGYDCLGDQATAKNIITVGAVEKISNYTDASSVKMSTFSSWGPTDDGRIKPDLVAAGVGLFSLSATGTNQYTTLSGTSMATPNTTGSLALLQQLHKKMNAGRPMKAATLKALAIHTVKEAGFAAGPDYRFGWGLLDVAAGSKALIQTDDANVFVKELGLDQGGTVVIPITPKANTKVTATIVWTDPAATALPASLDPTNLRLVNDLDLRVLADGENHSPWILDPANNEAAATQGDNFRDNVEKIEFVTGPVLKDYSVRVTHKGTLTNLKQNFSLVITLTSADSGSKYYWIGNSTNWSSTSNWSLTSGGASAGSLPGIDDMVFFDENSFKNGVTTVSLSQNVSCGSLVWLSSANSSLTFNGHSITVRDNFRIGSSTMKANDEGSIFFHPQTTSEKTFSMDGNDFSKVSVTFEGDAVWRMIGGFDLNGISLLKGELNITGLTVSTRKLTAVSLAEKTLNAVGATIENIESSEIDSNLLTFESEGTQLITSTTVPAILDWTSVDYDGELTVGTPGAILDGNNIIQNVHAKGDLELLGNNMIAELVLDAGVSLLLAENTVQQLSDETTLNSTTGSPVTIKALAGSATLDFAGHYKLCFDNLIIENVEAGSTGVVNAGLNSTLVNAPNWLEQECSDVLFPDFTFEFNCANSVVEFTDLSEGGIETWSWDFGDDNSDFEISDEPNGRHVFKAPGTYQVTLTISKPGFSESFTTEVEINSNSIDENTIVLSNQRLFSVKPGTTYQWYKNQEVIEGEVQRFYDYAGQPGSYSVVTRSASCSRISAPYIVNGIDEEISKNVLRVYPNPVLGNHFTIEVNETVLPAQMQVYDHLGRLITESRIFDFETIVPMNGWRDGIYNLVISNGKLTVARRIVIK